MKPTSTKDLCAAIVGLGTAAPPSISQTKLADQLASRCCDEGDEAQRAKFNRIFANCGVRHRGLVAHGIEFYPERVSPTDRGPTTGRRMKQYAIDAPPLAERAACAALADAKRPAGRVTHLITVSCTGFFAPGLDAELMQRLGLSAAVHRTQIGFMGCHGAFNAIAAARDIALADRSACVLICSVELCSLHFAYGWSPQQLVANALFADGAAAIVIEARADRPQHSWSIDGASSLLLENSCDDMRWIIGDHGFEMTLSPKVPALVEANLQRWCAATLSEQNIAIDSIEHWAIHPGGPKVIDAVERALSLPTVSTQPSREVLADRGNMSSATILFILDRLRSQRGATVALGFGPGLTMEAMMLSRR